MQKLIQLIETKNFKGASEYLSQHKGRMAQRDVIFFSGLLHQLNGDVYLAKNKYVELLKKYPSDLATIINLSAIYNEIGNYFESNKLLSTLPLETGSNEFQIALFDSYFGMRKYDAANYVLQRLLIALGSKAELLERKAALLLQQGYTDSAVKILEDLSKTHGEFRPQIYGNLAAALNRSGDYERAHVFAQRAIKAKPSSWQFRLNLANSLMSMDRNEESYALLSQLLSEGHRAPEILGNMSRLENLQGNIQESLAFCEEGLLNYPDDVNLICCKADNYSYLGDVEKSFSHYRRAIQLKADDETSNWHFALALLRDKHYQEGWRQYKWGFKKKKGGRGLYRFNPNGEWNGDAKIKRLLVWGEQGVGDELMFSKFLKYIPKTVESIELRVDPRLVPVLKLRSHLHPNIDIKPYSDEEILPHIPIGNLPALFWKNYEVDDKSRDPFLSRFNDDKSRKIRLGITWRGGLNKRFQVKRSIPLGVFKRIEALKNDENIQIIMLQYNPRADELGFLSSVFNDRLSLPNYDAVKNLEAWVDHIDTCDLIVSVDNSAVHISGALGIPTLAMLPSHPDFRWGREGEKSIWYESVELLRGSNNISNDDLAKIINNWLLNKLAINH